MIGNRLERVWSYGYPLRDMTALGERLRALKYERIVSQLTVVDMAVAKQQSVCSANGRGDNANLVQNLVYSAANRIGRLFLWPRRFPAQ